jgi:hypothetical protein
VNLSNDQTAFSSTSNVFPSMIPNCPVVYERHFLFLYIVISCFYHPSDQFAKP